MKLKLILFDFSGTLAYLRQPDPKEFFLTLDNFGIKIETPEEIKSFASLFAGLLGFTKNWLDFSEKLFRDYNPPAARGAQKKVWEGGGRVGVPPKRAPFVEKLGRETIKNLADFFSKTIIFELYDDVKEIFALPFQKAILSANARFIVESLGLQRFAEIFTPGETKTLKPDPKAFLVVLNKLKVKPEEVLMVGDEVERDLIPAQKLGMKTVLVDRENKVKDYSGIKINSLGEIKNILGL